MKLRALMPCYVKPLNHLHTELTNIWYNLGGNKVVYYEPSDDVYAIMGESTIKGLPVTFIPIHGSMPAELGNNYYILSNNLPTVTIEDSGVTITLV